MPDFVRAKAENGSEVTVPRSYAEKHKLVVLDDKPALDARGFALSEKPKVSLTPAGGKYQAMKPEDLQAEADKRGLTVQGSGANGNVLKADLVDALVANDAAS